MCHEWYNVWIYERIKLKQGNSVNILQQRYLLKPQIQYTCHDNRNVTSYMYKMWQLSSWNGHMKAAFNYLHTRIISITFKVVFLHSNELSELELPLFKILLQLLFCSTLQDGCHISLNINVKRLWPFEAAKSQMQSNITIVAGSILLLIFGHKQTLKTVLSSISGGRGCWISQFSGFQNVMPNVYLSV